MAASGHKRRSRRSRVDVGFASESRHGTGPSDLQLRARTGSGPTRACDSALPLVSVARPFLSAIIQGRNRSQSPPPLQLTVNPTAEFSSGLASQYPFA